MAFVRVSRDKRGYEHIYLIDSTARRGRPSRPRVLYWFRTPPGVMVGREPFDESVRHMLEAQYPDVTFDWEKLRKMAIPAPDVEPWRERRRVERAAKQARQAGDREETDATPSGTAQGSPQLDGVSMRAAERPAEDLEADALPDSPDIDLIAETILEIRSAESLEPLEAPEPLEPRELRELRELGEPRELREPLESLEPLEPLEPLETLEPLEPLEPVEPLEPFEPHDPATPDVLIQAAPSGVTPSQIEQHRRRRRRGGRRRRHSSGPGGTSSNAPSDSRKDDEPTG